MQTAGKTDAGPAIDVVLRDAEVGDGFEVKCVDLAMGTVQPPTFEQ